MRSMRNTAWFVAIACAMAVWMGALGALRGEAVAGVIASAGSDEGSPARAADLEKVRAFLERRVVQERLQDYGVSPAVATAKVAAMSDRDLHRIAALQDRLPDGSSTDVLGVLIGVLIVAILITLIFKILGKEIIVR